MNQETRNYMAEKNLFDGDEIVTQKHILDSGERRQFKSGAVRDIQKGKGRCDLLPLGEIARFFQIQDNLTVVPDEFGFFSFLHDFIRRRDENDIYSAIKSFIVMAYDDDANKAILELSMHYEGGAVKYAERNWEKGINLHCYVDSATRHYLKYFAGWDDEPHDRAVLWNLFCLLWTYHYKPELDDLPRYDDEEKGE